MIKNKIKKIVFSKLSKNTINLIYSFYYRIRYPEQMQKKKTFGDENEDKIFYVIRPRTDGVEGLMSLFINVIKNMAYAEANNYTSVVDFKNYNTQYKVENENAWELFFTQPSLVSLDEVYRSKHVILSGLEIQKYENPLINKSFNSDDLKRLHDFVFSKINYSEAVHNTVETEVINLELNLEKTLGLYLRGTDYVALKPAGHPVQPTVAQAIEIVDQYLDRYEIDYIFLVTEDFNIYKKVKSKYGDMCHIVSYDKFVENYNGADFLSKDSSISELDESPYKRGLNYLVKLIILSKCAYFIGGDTMGSWASCILADERFIDKYIFNLGIYR